MRSGQTRQIHAVGIYLSAVRVVAVKQPASGRDHLADEISRNDRTAASLSHTHTYIDRRDRLLNSASCMIHTFIDLKVGEN